VFTRPQIVILNRLMSKLEIYEEVWSSVRQKLNKTKDSKFVKNENLLWWRSP